MLLVLGLTAGGSLAFYAYTTYMQKYLVNTAGMDARTVSLVMAAALFCFMLLQPAFGALADRIGRKLSLVGFGLFGALMTVPVMGAMGRSGGSPYAAFGILIGALAVVSLYTAISGLVKAELFPTQVRALGVGLPYAVANAVFGGTAEYVGLWFKSVGAEWGFAWYVTGFFCLALLVALLMPDTRRHGHLIGDHAIAEAG